MGAFRPLATVTARWRPAGGDGLEHLTVQPCQFDFGAGIRAESVLVGARDAEPYGVRYRIDCSADWRVMRFSVETTAGRRLALIGDGNGRWRDESGASLGHLDGCIDIDLAGTPFTNSLPIRRLDPVPQAGGAELRMVYVPFSTFEPFVDLQRYTCLQAGRLYRYEAVDRSFSVELPVDADGLVIDYPGLFRRLL